MASIPSPEQIRSVPKVLLHDHLDGGLRPSTVIELADAVGHALPSTDATKLEKWFFCGGDDVGDLPKYLEKFSHTFGVMQTPDALHRVASEAAQDLAADGVVYAEVRFGPSLHTSGGMVLDEIIETVVAGLAEGSKGTLLKVGVLAVALRNQSDSVEIAEAALRHRDRGVVGFDIAGPEDGYPPELHLAAFHLLQRESFHFTIHAGEAFGPRSIWKALQWCGAERLGHGYRIIDDIDMSGDSPTVGPLAAYVRDRRIPLEICPTSNVHIGAVESVAQHPIGLLYELGFRVTVNTDNRLMSRVTTTSEMLALVRDHAWDWSNLHRVTVNAAKSAFLPFEQRVELIENIINPAYEGL